MFLKRLFSSEIQRYSILHEKAPIYFQEELFSRKKVLLKSGSARIGFVHIASLKVWKD
jgi:hypothetical protein